MFGTVKAAMFTSRRSAPGFVSIIFYSMDLDSDADLDHLIFFKGVGPFNWLIMYL